jgi:hypothetical protein
MKHACIIYVSLILNRREPCNTNTICLRDGFEMQRRTKKLGQKQTIKQDHNKAATMGF